MLFGGIMNNDILYMQTPDLNKERLIKLKELFPDIFTGEGKLDIEEVKKIVDPQSVTDVEKFEFRWFGKSGAKRLAFTPTKTTLAYDKKRSVNPDDSNGNMIIEGENLEVLKCLLAGYREKIKCIYIDPPYNTGNDFIYSDKWDESKEDYLEHIGVTQDGIKLDTNTEASGRYHSNWLCMMYSRLLVARQLLREDGVIFISIDDNEVHHLRKLCDEVFWQDNFVATICIQANKGGQDYKDIAKTHEYLICYTKYSETELNEIENKEKKLPFNDNIGKFEIRELRNRNPKFGKFNRPNLFFPIYINPNAKNEDGFCLVSLIKNDKYFIESYPYNSEGKESCWRWSKPLIEKNNTEDILTTQVIAKQKNDGNWNIYEKCRKTTSKVKTIWDETNVRTEQGTIELRDLYLKGFFDHPKPVSIIKKCIEIAIQDKDDIILDFFAGSGTTAQAVMELNREDGGNRKFILVQVPELTDEKSEAYKAGYKKISDITIERNKRVIQKIEEETKNNKDLFNSMVTEDKSISNLGFKVYRLAKSNFTRVDFKPDTTKDENENNSLLKNYIQDKEFIHLSMVDEKIVLDEILLKNGFTLNYKIQKLPDFSKNTVYNVVDGYRGCLICIDMNIAEETFKILQEYKDKVFICLEKSLDTSMKWNLTHLFNERLVSF